ncbi:protein lin-37 homolog [Planococcus citri]|uniref:protein lin-37 homolog n=1 Tax=Planococcus citri TaxID=170843 RepID=UPI0031F9FE7A
MSKVVKRRKARKNKDSPLEKKFKERDGEVALARGRLAGALKGILNHNNDDCDDLDLSGVLSPSLNSNSKRSMIDHSSMTWKKPKANNIEDHQSYFMKLNDRSVDLAQFDINTPLYPICRAWIQNEPILAKKTEDSSCGLLEIKHDEDVDSRSLDLNEKPYRSRLDTKEVNQLPPPKPLPEGVTTLKIPQVSPHKTPNFILNADQDQAPSREELLKSHLQNWSTVRKKWRDASFKNEERYAASKEILTKMFERAQVQFQMPIV